MRKSNEYHMNIGGASIILLLIVFALTIFAALSVRTSYHEMKLAKKTKESVEEFYRLDSEATEIKNKISREFRQAMYLAQDGIIRDMFNSDGVTQEGNVVKYSVTAASGNCLNVTLELNTDATVTVKEWRLVEREHGDYEGNPDIWDGDITIIE